MSFVTSRRPRSGLMGDGLATQKTRVRDPSPCPGYRQLSGWSGTPEGLRLHDERRKREGGRAAALSFRSGTRLAVAVAFATRTAVTAASAAAPASAAAVVTARAVLLRRPRRCILRPLDQLLRLDEAAVLVLRDQLEA